MRVQSWLSDLDDKLNTVGSRGPARNLPVCVSSLAHASLCVSNAVCLQKIRHRFTSRSLNDDSNEGDGAAVTYLP